MSFARAIGSIAGSATLLLRRIRDDQKRIWSCSWTSQPALAVIGTTAALIVLDPITAPYIQREIIQENRVIRQLNLLLTGENMSIVINGVPLFFYVMGFVLGRPYMWRTGLLAGEAAADAEIVAVTLKHLDRRVRPVDLGLEGDYFHTWFKTKRRDIGGAGCFPSGHTAAAFAVARIFAARFPRYNKVALAAAVLIGCSRLHSRAHFLSDVFFGAAMGYSISQFVVLRRAPLMDPAEHPEQQDNQQNRPEADTVTAAGAPAAITVIPTTTTQ